jgi:predicted dehydrogenase
MLDKEKDLDAVIIATPDFWHADHTVDCLKAGLHVYCEKEMSNTLEGARKMVQAARQTGKLLQIGHQRRSNPRYIFCYEKLLKQAKLLGQITAVNGQWNRSVAPPRITPRGKEIDTQTLTKYGYKSMQQLRNWRWYKGLGGGPIVDLGSHQIDVYNWFLDALPQLVMASGRTNYYDKKTHEWYDTVMAVYEYQTTQGPVTAFYQTISTNSSNGYYESFMGTEGTLMISEPEHRCGLYREGRVPETKWDKWVGKGYLKKSGGLNQSENKDAVGDIRPPSPKLAKYDMLDTMGDKLYHQPHLENFFDAIRGKAKLNCPPEVGYETAVAVLKVNIAAESGRKLEFEPAEFKA